MTDETVPCTTCGQPTRMTGTKKCDWCYEVETRLAGYLRRGGPAARNFVKDALESGGDPPFRAEVHIHEGPLVPEGAELGDRARAIRSDHSRRVQGAGRATGEEGGQVIFSGITATPEEVATMTRLARPAATIVSNGRMLGGHGALVRYYDILTKKYDLPFERWSLAADGKIYLEMEQEEGERWLKDLAEHRAMIERDRKLDEHNAGVMAQTYYEAGMENIRRDREAMEKLKEKK